MHKHLMETKQCYNTSDILVRDIKNNCSFVIENQFFREIFPGNSFLHFDYIFSFL